MRFGGRVVDVVRFGFEFESGFVDEGRGELSIERGISREGREEEVGVEIRGIRRPVTEDSRGEAIVDILVICGIFCVIGEMVDALADKWWQ